MKKFMKKLNTLSKNKKSAFIFIYGPIASGKLTIAKELSKKTGYKNFHNHLIIDLCLQIFGKNDETRPVFREKIYYEIIKLLAQLKVPTILTHAYASNFIFKTGVSDPEYVKNVEKTVSKYGGVFYGVQLVCNEKELLRRLKYKSRKEFHKLKDSKTMQELLGKYDHTTAAPVKNNLVIDNTKISAKKVADMIVKHYKLDIQ